MIKLSHITFSYGGKEVLTDFSMTLPARGVTALSGPSGCGKTTLMSIVAGRLTPQSGAFQGYTNPVILFQENRLFPWRTCGQHVRDVLPKERWQEVSHWLDLVELAEEEHHYPKALSGGMERRLALARALACSGDIYLLDEPFAGVDGERMARILNRIKEQIKAPVILSTHQKELLDRCDTVITLEGPPLHVTKQAVDA